MYYVVELESWKNVHKGTTGYVFEEYDIARYYGFQTRQRAFKAARELIAAKHADGRKAFAIVRSPDGSGVAVGGWRATCYAMNWNYEQFRKVAKEILKGVKGEPTAE